MPSLSSVLPVAPLAAPSDIAQCMRKACPCRIGDVVAVRQEELRQHKQTVVGQHHHVLQVKVACGKLRLVLADIGATTASLVVVRHRNG